MKKSSRFLVLATVAILAVMATGCSKRIGPGYVGIKVKLSGDNRGVDSTALTTGRVFFNPMTEQVLEWPTFIQTAVWSDNPNEGRYEHEAVTFTTGDQMRVDADISLAYKLKRGKVPQFYTDFRSADIDAFTHGFMRNLAREVFNDIAGRYKIEQIMGDNGPFLKEVQTLLQERVEPWGVVIEQFGFIGVPRPPDAVVAAINAKVSATQAAIRVENEVRQARAEAEKAIAKAHGEAESNKILSASLSPTLLEWRRLSLQEQALNKWNGALPSTMVPGSSVPFIGVR